MTPIRVHLWAMTMLLSLASASHAGEAFELRDDFAGYEAGSDGAPRWAPEGIDWAVADGRYEGSAIDRDFAFPAKAPHAKRVTVEATLILRKALGKEWKTAGLAVVADRRNYWNLALVEAPEAQDRRHYVELCEMLDGAWLSQSEPATRLTVAEAKNPQFDWQYDRPYRLRLELAPEGIRGSVAEGDGREAAAFAFKFDNKAVTFGRPALSVHCFEVAFDDVAVRCEETVPAPEERKWAFPPYAQAGRVPLPDRPRGKATGFFHVEAIDGRWWVIDPKGRAFFVVGTDHANFRAHWCEKLGYAPYHRNMVEQFKTEEAWAESTAERLLAWGFNTVAAGHSESLRGRGLAWTGFLSLGAAFSNVSDICPRVHWTGFPNVFHPKFPASCDRRAREACVRFREDPWLLGYFIDNELEWYGKEHQPWSLTDEAFKKPADHSAKQALLNWLRGRYPTIEQLNAAWGTQAASYDAVAQGAEPLRHTTERGKADKLDFLRLVAERYFAITTAAIRKHDPNHMVLGCRFAGQIPPGVGAVAGRRCDIFTINCYRWVDLETGEVRGFEDDLAHWYAEVKRPFMITEWSFPALDSGLPCKHGAGQRFDTQAQKAQAFTIFQKLLFATPFVVGSDYFMWVDEPAEGISSTFPEDSNYGLVNVHNKPYKELTEAAARLHPQVYPIHAGQVPVLTLKLEREPWRSVVTNRAEVEAEAVLEITRAGRTERRRIRVPAGGSSAVPLGEVPSEPPATLSGSGPQGRVELARTADGWRIDNDCLQLLKDRPGGSAFDRVLLTAEARGAGGVANGLALNRYKIPKHLGSFVPVIWQDVGQSLWPKPDTARIVGVSNGPVRLALDIEFELKRASEQKVITTVDDEGKRAEQARQPGAFKTCYRFYVYPGKPWFGARFLWIENTDTRPWDFQAYFHYALSSLAGDASDDEVGGPDVPGYYLRDRFALWSDRQAKLHYGIAQGRARDFQMLFWKDPAGGQHADVRREVKVTLKPGERWPADPAAEPQPVAYIFGVSGEAGERPWAPVLDEIRRWEAVDVKLLPPER